MLEPVKKALGSWEQRLASQSYREFQVILKRWEEIVGQHVAQHAQPVGLKDALLRVATSSSAWSQHLMFERQRIVAKLNAQLSITLVDIRFQPGLGSVSVEGKATRSNREASPNTLKSHPSWVETAPIPRPVQPAATPQEAFERWSEQILHRERSLSLCPQCHCPTPPGELERWSMCAFCITKHWRPQGVGTTQPKDTDLDRRS